MTITAIRVLGTPCFNVWCLEGSSHHTLVLILFLNNTPQLSDCATHPHRRAHLGPTCAAYNYWSVLQGVAVAPVLKKLHDEDAVCCSVPCCVLSSLCKSKTTSTRLTDCAKNVLKSSLAAPRVPPATPSLSLSSTAHTTAITISTEGSSVPFF